MPSRPRPPTYNLKTIFKAQDQLAKMTWVDFYGVSLKGDVFEAFARVAHTDLPGSKNIPFATVYQSLQPFVGEELTSVMVQEASWRLAGNLHRLRQGIPVYPWKGQIEEEQVP